VAIQKRYTVYSDEGGKDNPLLEIQDLRSADDALDVTPKIEVTATYPGVEDGHGAVTLFFTREGASALASLLRCITGEATPDEILSLHDPSQS
jgi:hypothetical protein